MFGRAYGTFAGVPIHVSANATKTAPRFPEKKWTKRRRRRVIAKHGSWFVTVPAVFVIGGTYVMHPAKLEELRRASKLNNGGLEL